MCLHCLTSCKNPGLGLRLTALDLKLETQLVCTLSDVCQMWQTRNHISESTLHMHTHTDTLSLTLFPTLSAHTHAQKSLMLEGRHTVFRFSKFENRVFEPELQMNP